jgi:Alpha-2,8-polysialyltransferase (POLYST)
VRRLVFAHGPWQLLLAASALKQVSSASPTSFQDVLVILDRGAWSSDPSDSLEPGGFSRVVGDTRTASLGDGPFPSPIGAVMSRIAPVVWPWSHIVILNIDDNATWRNLADSRRPAEILRANLNVAEPDVLWFDCLGGAELDPHRVVYRVAAEAYAKAQIVLYEDGLDTYIPLDDLHFSLGAYLTNPRMAYRALKARVRQWRKPNDLSREQLLPRHLARVAASYLWITLMVPLPAYQRRLPWVQLQTRFMKDTIRQVSPIVDDIDLKDAGTGGRPAIVLGQCFASWGVLRRDFELNCYIDMTKKLQQLGYEIIWKEHPRRAQDPLFPDLAAAVAGIRAIPDLGPWPIELFIERLGIAACASLTSTTLFSAPLLFSIPSFSTVARYISTLRYPNDVMARLVAGSIPDLHENGQPVHGWHKGKTLAAKRGQPTDSEFDYPVESVH